MLSITIPLYNEAENIAPLYERVVAELEALGRPFEVILVNDGSTDGSERLLDVLAAKDARVKVVHFRRNYGQTAAMMAGIRYASGEIIIPMDGDLQNDPADIAKLLAKLDDGFDVVSGWRKERKDRAVTRRLPSWLANRLISRWSGVRLHDYGCSLKAYRRSTLAGVHLYGEMHRFIPIYAAQQGARVTEIVVNHRPRVHGTTKYGLGRAPNVFLDLLLVSFLRRYGTKPIHLFGKVGLYNLFASILAFALMIYFKFWGGKTFVETPLPLLAIMFFSVGCLSILMGLLAEVTMRTYHESSQRRTYLVRETFRGGKAT